MRRRASCPPFVQRCVLTPHSAPYLPPQTGALTSSLSENAQKISGLAGTTLGTIIQSCATIVSGAIIGLIYGWKLSLIGIACIPLIICALPRLLLLTSRRCADD